jgi:hypothetical protein
MDLLIEAMESLATFDFSSDRTAGAHELVQLVANSAIFRRNHSTSSAARSISSFMLWTRTALSSASSQSSARRRYQSIACSSSINDTIAWCAASVCSDPVPTPGSAVVGHGTSARSYSERPSSAAHRSIRRICARAGSVVQCASHLVGGGGRNRTGVDGFAGRYLNHSVTPPSVPIFRAWLCRLVPLHASCLLRGHELGCETGVEG